MNSNVLFIIIDSLRADKFHGSKKTSVTPNIDNFIKKGAYFSETISSSDVTGICVGNIFTGMFSQKTGIIQRKFNSKIMLEKTMFFFNLTLLLIIWSPLFYYTFILT